MATEAVNNLVRLVGGSKHISYPILSDGTADIKQGELLYWDSSAKVVKPIATDGNAATGAGVAMKSSFLNLYGTKKYEASMEAQVGAIHSLKTTSGDTYNAGDAVYIGADAQTVTTVAATNVIGYVVLRDGQSAITGAANVNVDVLVVAKSPVSPLT